MNVRAYTSDDAAAVAKLAAADEERFYGRPSHIAARDVEEWTSRAKDAWVWEEDGAVVAAAWCEVWGDTAVIVGMVGAKGRGLGSAVVDQAEQRLASEEWTKIHAITLEPDAAARALFEGRGYTEVRRFYEMAVELTETPVVPAVPDGLVLREFTDEDARAFHATSQESFQDHWNWTGMPFDEWWEMRKGQDRDEHGPLWFLVADGDEVAAVVRNEANRHGGGYVGLIGVRREWRGRGLAKLLLYHTFAEFWRRGMKRVTLGVDAESPTGATHLYERVGMHVESATVVFEKPA